MLKRLTVLHAAGIFDYLSDPKESPDIFFPRPTSVEDTVKWIMDLIFHGTVAYVVILDGKPAGVVTYKLVPQNWGNATQTQIGFYFKVSARGRIFQYVQQSLEEYPRKWLTVIATPYPDNTRCARFLTKLGFHYSHSMKEYDLWERRFK
jgi:RimJ/RimL family protein N-acetyltransferase